jgi:hypothetical protein
MNQKRKAELQRKLSMTSVPRPPAGLLERIKADIPHDLKMADRERERFSRSTAFTMRVAASIILLISSVYVTIHLMSRSDERGLMPPTMAMRKTAAPPAEVTIDLAEAPKPAAAASPAHAVAPPARQHAVQTAELEERKKVKEEDTFITDAVQTRKDQQLAAKSSSGAEGGAQSGSAVGDAYAPLVVAEARDAAAAPPSAPQPASAVEQQAENGRANAKQAAVAKLDHRNETVTVTAAAPVVDTGTLNNVTPSRTFADISSHAVFGLSVDPEAFARVRKLIDQGQRPAPGTVDVAGVVNYLAGTTASPAAVDLEVEGSRAPITPNTILIRFTVETEHTDGSSSAVASDANLTISLNSEAVLSHRLIGAETLKAQSTLSKNLSVTGVVEAELNPAVQPSAKIATLRLRYRSAIDGQIHAIDKIVRAAQVTHSWDSASLRHRRATLGAIWSESINRGGRATRDMAQRAERLAIEAPDDARARELAAAASAFSRLQSSGPTGSGR